jgi:hypothetical protein
MTQEPVDELFASIRNDAKELSMPASSVAPVAEFTPEKPVLADPGPMSQQDAADCHGHEMHPQKFVRLVGCHESHEGQEAANHLH